MEKSKIVVLISGRGSNLNSLIDQAISYEIVAVGTDKAEAKGIDIAKEHNIPTFICDRKSYSTLSEQKEDIFNKVDSYNPDYIALAGFMLYVPPQIVQKFKGKVINIHPALLPKFKGIDTHKRALEAKEKEHGCSVHFVDEGIDTGLIIAQAGCFIAEDETEESLAQKVLKHEHAIYPWVINNLASKDITLQNEVLKYTKKAMDSAIHNGFILL